MKHIYYLAALAALSLVACNKDPYTPCNCCSNNNGTSTKSALLTFKPSASLTKSIIDGTEFPTDREITDMVTYVNHGTEKDEYGNRIYDTWERLDLGKATYSSVYDAWVNEKPYTLKSSDKDYHPRFTTTAIYDELGIIKKASQQYDEFGRLTKVVYYDTATGVGSINNSVDNPEDFLLAQSVQHSLEWVGSGDTKIPLTFKHMLTQLRFTFEKDESLENAKVMIGAVSMKIPQKAELCISYGETTTEEGRPMVASSDASYYWQPMSDEGYFTRDNYPSTYSGYISYPQKNAMLFREKFGWEPNEVEGDPYPNYPNEWNTPNYLDKLNEIIKQDGVGIVTMVPLSASNFKYPFSISGNIDGVDFNYDLNLTDLNGWKYQLEIGKCYNIHVVLSQHDLKFTFGVEPWVEEDMTLTM